MQFQAMYKAMWLLRRLAEGKPEPAVLPMRIQKCPFPEDGEAGTRLPRCSPEEAGVRPESIQRFWEAAAADRAENLHSLTVLRHGKVIAEYSVPPYDRSVWHVTHSLCKTVTALAVGILIGDGRLRTEDRILDLFADQVSFTARSHYGQLTVFHLLTMTAGASFCELQSVTEQDWVQGYLDSPPLFPVGERFHYNSMNSYMLAAIVCRKTGRTLSEFLQERLFGPMGIRCFHWETCPAGIEKGGWGLYLLQEDAAKLGQLVLNRGYWAGQSLVPEAYIRDLCAWHSDPPPEISRWGYGYQCWIWKRPGSVRFSGLFGQHVLVIPDLDMVIAANAGSGCMFGESHFLELCSVFLEETAHPVQRGTDKAKNGLEFFCGKAYQFTSGFARILPLFLQVMGNCYTTGLNSVAFSCEADALYMNVKEGVQENRIPIGFSGPIPAVLEACGEQHRVAVRGKWMADRAIPQLDVDIVFLEQACTRHLQFLFQPDGTLRLRLSETPDKEALLEGLRLLTGPEKRAHVLLEGQFRARLELLAAPELTGLPETVKSAGK